MKLPSYRLVQPLFSNGCKWQDAAFVVLFRMFSGRIACPRANSAAAIIICFSAVLIIIRSPTYRSTSSVLWTWFNYCSCFVYDFVQELAKITDHWTNLLKKTFSKMCRQRISCSLPWAFNIEREVDPFVRWPFAWKSLKNLLGMFDYDKRDMPIWTQRTSSKLLWSQVISSLFGTEKNC